MNSILKRSSVEEEQSIESFHLLGTIAVILLFLTFVGAGFYLYITNYA